MSPRFIHRLLLGLGALVVLGFVAALLWSWRLPSSQLPATGITARGTVVRREQNSRATEVPAAARQATRPAESSLPRKTLATAPPSSSSAKLFCQVAEDGTGEPVPGVAVVLIPTTGKFAVKETPRSDAAGMCQFEVADPGTYSLQARMVDDVVSSTTIELQAGEAEEVRIVVPERDAWHFRVVDTAGEPLPGRSVRLGPGSSGQVPDLLQPFVRGDGTTDGRGEVELKAYSVAARGELNIADAPEISWARTGPWQGRLELGWDQLTAAGQLINVFVKGGLVEAHGHVHGVPKDTRVECGLIFQGQALREGENADVTDDEVTFEGVPGSVANLTLTLNFHDSNRGVIHFRVVELPGTPGRFDFDITLPEAATVRGVLADSAGEPVHRGTVALVALRDGAGRGGTIDVFEGLKGLGGCQTEEDGRFRIDLPEGDEFLILAMREPGQSDAVEGFTVLRRRREELLDHDLALRLDPPLQLRGLVVLEDGTPLAGADIEIPDPIFGGGSIAGIFSHRSKTTSGEDGTFTLPVGWLNSEGIRVHVGEFTVGFDDLVVRATKDGMPKTDKWLDLRDRGRAVIRVGPTRTLQGTVTLSGGPVTRYFLRYSSTCERLHLEPDAHVHMIFDPDGRFRLDSLDRDIVDVAFTVPGSGIVVTRTFDLRDGDITDAVISME